MLNSRYGHVGKNSVPDNEETRGTNLHWYGDLITQTALARDRRTPVRRYEQPSKTQSFPILPSA